MTVREEILQFLGNPVVSLFASQAARELDLSDKDIFAILSELKQPEYELTLLVIACQLRISECLAALARHPVESGADCDPAGIRSSHLAGWSQEEAISVESRGSTPGARRTSKMAEQTKYADNDDFVFPSGKVRGKQTRSGSMLVEDYLRPAAIRVGVITVKDGVTYDREGEIVKRF